VLAKQGAVVVGDSAQKSPLKHRLLLFSLRKASSLRATGSLSPSTMRLSIAQADLPVTSVATEASLMLASSRTFWIRLIADSPLLDQLAPLTGEVPQLPDRLVRDEAAAQKSVLKKLRDPLTVHHVAFDLVRS
jgi:hypothetical protein